MTVALVHSQRFVGSSPLAITPSPAPTPGNLMVLCVTTHNHGLGPSSIPGWTIVPPGIVTATTSFTRDFVMFYRVAEAGDTSWTPAASASVFMYSEWSGVGPFQDSVGLGEYGPTFDFVAGGPLAITGGALIIGGIVGNNTGSTANVWNVATIAPSIELDDRAGGGGNPFWSAYRVESAPGTYTVAGTATNTNGVPGRVAGVTAAFDVVAPPVADFTADQVDGVAPLTVQFDDTSTGSPTSWAWDFGDGGTSTSQNPSHVYAAPGTYAVSLTATNADGADTETKAAYITAGVDVGYEPPEPAGALIEIYAAAPGSARWGIAKWGEAVWSSATWQDVTPESVRATIRWGSNRPELGILSQPDAGSWAIATYDPDRLLDPANADSPWATDLQPHLPIRASHRGVVVRRGHAETIAYDYATERGAIRVTDNQATLANAEVPPDTALANTLYARARDAIAAAALAVEVLPDPVGGDPALVAWVTGTERSAWQWIADAAQQVLHVPYIDRLGRLGFRPWAAPLDRGRSIEAPELVGLQSVSSFAGLYSVIQVRDDTGAGGAIVERALTPPPRYGKRTFLRDEPTPAAAAWADAVLEDRALPGLRWVPGTVRPLDAVSVERLATIEPVELVSLAVSNEEPPVLAGAIIVGGEITITAKRAAAAVWSFRFEAAQSATPPLLADGADPPEYLLSEAGDEFLYPG